MKKIRIFLCLLLLISIDCTSQTLNDTIALINKAMAIYLPENPGSQLSIKKNGKIIFSKAYGMADLEHNVPLTLTSKIEAGSVSKQFTAAAILLLEQQGKLSLNDDVRKYITELPDYGNIITLEQMMHHTSGLKDWGSIAGLTGWGRTTKTFTNNDALLIITSQKTLNNKPGAEFIYSNSNYTLFAIIVERVTGLSLAEFTKKNIFIPAGMTHTEWRDNHNRIVKERAIAYNLEKDEYQTNMPNEDAYGNGGLLTTTEDLLKWNEFYQSGKFGTPSLFSKQCKTEKFNNGKMNNYAAGLFIIKYNGYEQIMHDGATASYRAYLETFPELNLSIAFLSNTSQFDNSKNYLGDIVRDLFISEKEKAKTEEKEKTINIAQSVLDSYAGWYKNDRTGVGTEIEIKDGKLFFNKLPFESESEYRFKNGSRIIEINHKKGLLNYITNTDTITFSKVQIAENSNLDSFTGKYFSAETNSTLMIFQKEGKLFVQLKPKNEYQLVSTYQNAFNIMDFGGNLYFLKDKKNKISSMKVSLSRARNIEFVKLP
ncbi:serine hydrolase domain-containing protein [Flavobacterium sp. 245]|uniref:serine hydrolase domain-containing protein n=1 Tax=Flavobacterium sp. 245 TaxID=2512115 RepID=UPI0010604BA0|nr:serine hydrolase domain-containing protein [Flavobacterium sp. 245]TDP03153.1 CubicO group peptidase (beta-lactamase class C family) [Flavobacterium sp. 245]